VSELRGGPEPWLAIFNPVSGNSSRRARWRGIEQALRAAKLPLEIVETDGPRHGTEIARAAVVSGRRRILIAGGDGSAHDVVNQSALKRLPFRSGAHGVRTEPYARAS